MKFFLYSFSTWGGPRYAADGSGRITATGDTRNLGDYIQELAALSFLPRCDGFIDRDRLADYQGSEELCIIGNGWYDLNDRQHAFGGRIRLCPISIHHAAGDLRYAPRLCARLRSLARTLPKGVGCRDLHTLELFRRQGIPAWFSSCLTTTLSAQRLTALEDKVKACLKRGWHERTASPAYLAALQQLRDWSARLQPGHYLVACDVEAAGLRGITSLFIPGTASAAAVRWHNLFRVQQHLRGLLAAYRRQPVVHLTHRISSRMAPWELLDVAYRVLLLYRDASLVVTSRLHAALPCLAMSTPLLMLRERFDSRTQTYRRLKMLNYIAIADADTRCLTAADGRVVNPRLHCASAAQLASACTAFVRSATAACPA